MSYVGVAKTRHKQDSHQDPHWGDNYNCVTVAEVLPKERMVQVPHWTLKPAGPAHRILGFTVSRSYFMVSQRLHTVSHTPEPRVEGQFERSLG